MNKYRNIENLTEEELAEEIRKHNYFYWKEHSPEISDIEYDNLLRRLEELNPNHPLLQKVGAPEVASMGKVSLSTPMISLDKTYYFKDAPKGKKSLMKWVDEIKRSDDEVFQIQPKYDGISAVYTDGILATRGQGTEEENVSDKIPLIELETINYKGPLDRPVRGEILIRNDDFENFCQNIRKTNGETYKNSRNAVGGIMGLKDIEIVKKQGAKLTLIDYNLISYSVRADEFEKKWFEIVEEIESLPYPIDGIVIKLADENYRESLGYTAHHPRGQIAFKFTSMRKKTKLVDAYWSFGKNSLTPVGKVEPVEINGATITNVTLHNLEMIEKNDWKIGDYVLIERAGDVIPHIVGSEPGENRKSFIISHCPSCNSKLVRNSTDLKCVNPECFETRLQKLFSAIRNIGIEEIGEPTIRKMMTTLNVRELKDIFELSTEDISRLEGFKKKSSENLYNNIQKAKTTYDFQLIAALNIEGIGKITAEKILSDYTINEIRNMSRSRLAAIPEIGPETSGKLYHALREQSDILDELLETVNVVYTKRTETPKELICLDIDSSKVNKPLSHYENLIKMHNMNKVKPVDYEGDIYLPENLKNLVTIRNKNSKSKLIKKAKELNLEIMSPEEWENSLPAVPESDLETEEKTICFTGKMPEKREYYENLARDKGYKPVDKVTKDLTLLVASDPNSNSSKIKNAKKYGVEIAPLEEWLEDKKNTSEQVSENKEQENDKLPGF